MKTIELFSATESFSKVARAFGHETDTYEIDPVFNPDHCVDILELKNLPQVDVLWASPPCEGFSVASMGANWTGGKGAYVPKGKSAFMSIALAKKTIELIEQSKPTYWFIENPRGLLRKMHWMEDFLLRSDGRRRTVTYCQYGDDRMKPTDIWTNCKTWISKPMCSNGSSCHISAPRGSSTGTQGIKTYRDRSRIPEKLFIEIFNSLQN